MYIIIIYYKYPQISSDYDQKRLASCLYIKFYFTLNFSFPGGCGVGQTAGKQTRWRRPGATQKAVATHWSVPSDSGFCVYSPPLGALCSPLPFVWSEEDLSAYVIHCKIDRDESEHSTEYGQFEGVHLQIRWSTGLFMCYGFVGAFSFFVFCSPESKSCGAIEICLFVLYNKLLLNHLWSCVLKLVSWFLWGQGTRFKKKKSWFYSCSFSPPPPPPRPPHFFVLWSHSWWWGGKGSFSLLVTPSAHCVWFQLAMWCRIRRTFAEPWSFCTSATCWRSRTSCPSSQILSPSTTLRYLAGEETCALWFIRWCFRSLSSNSFRLHPVILLCLWTLQKIDFFKEEMSVVPPQSGDICIKACYSCEQDNTKNVFCGFDL